MHQVEVTHNSFVYPADFSPENYFRHCFGIIHSEGEDPETVEIKVFGNQRKYFETLPLHHSQVLVDDQTDYAIFQYLLHPTYDFIQELLSYGESVEVLKPIWLRQEVADIVQQMAQMYGN